MEPEKKRRRARASFLTSAAYFKELPPPEGVEFAVMGRSNVGKSSFINHAFEQQRLAKTSQKPGKTALANLFVVETDSGETPITWVDLPGYGYARAPGSERERWALLIRTYCEKRDNLKGIIWLIDIRHPGMKADLEARSWLATLGIPLLVILTKVDKVSRQQARSKMKETIDILQLSAEPVLYSTLDHGSRARFWDRFVEWQQVVTAKGFS